MKNVSLKMSSILEISPKIQSDYVQAGKRILIGIHILNNLRQKLFSDSDFGKKLIFIHNFIT